MDISRFAEIISDKQFSNFKKMNYKYPNDFADFIAILQDSYYEALPLKDLQGKSIVYLPICTGIHLDAVKLLYTAQSAAYGTKALEEEIMATSAIEQVDFSRDSVRNILKGLAPETEEENRIYGLKKGFEFISRKEHKITEENLYALYQMAIGKYLPEEDALLPGQYYRHAPVYVMSNKVEHSGIPHEKLPEYMQNLITFANTKDNMNDLLKAAVLHFYLSYVHPYFDGNGRMARLIHMWYLIQQGYESTLFVPLSGFIEKSRKKYYDAYTLTEANSTYAGCLDLTPFLLYMIQNVYDQLKEAPVTVDTMAEYKRVLATGEITQKEEKLWQFVLSTYAEEPFTTKQLERDFGDAAYATIRSFVLKFTDLALLEAQPRSNKVIYRVKKSG